LIGKTRQKPEEPNPRWRSPERLKISETCGDLANVAAANWRSHTRFTPPRELSDWIEHFWLERWQLEAGITKTRVLLPHPCVQLAFVPGRSRIYGPQLGRFVRRYTGNGSVFGVKFRAGAFHPFFRKPVSLIANTSIAAASVWPAATEAEQRILGCQNDDGMAIIATKFLLENLPQSDTNLRLVRGIIEAIIKDREVTRVHQLVARFDATERTLQRLFQRYVGASPRWVIKRYRAYEAIDHLNDRRPPPLAALAQHLGYFDQAHFANDFKDYVGQAPSRYAEYALGKKPSGSASRKVPVERASARHAQR
jgi:AraC-like DNA-binding protein